MARLEHLIIFALHIQVTLSLQDNVLLHGDAILAGLHEVNTYTDGACGKVVPKSVQIHEAVTWFFRHLNERNYVPNVTLGYHAFQTCGEPSRALQQTLTILNTYSAEQESYLIGLLGPERSSETQPVSRLLSSLPVEDRLPQISYSATAASLQDRSVYKNLFRVIPTDDMQVEVIIKLMQTLNWNYIGVIYEDEAYGRGAAESLKQQAKEVDICISIFVGLSVDSSTVSRRGEFDSIINMIQTRSESPVLGVVFFGRGSTLEDMIEYFDEHLELTQFQLIVSESLALDQVYLRQTVDTVHSRAKGLLTATPPYYDLEVFQQFWGDLHSNSTLMLHHLQESDWFLQYMEDITECSLTSLLSVDNECLENAIRYIQANGRLPMYVHYAVLGAATFAKAIKDLQHTNCGPLTGLCPALRRLGRMKLLHKMENINVSSSTEFDLEIPAFNLTFGFINGSIAFDQAENLSTYDVYNFQKCEDAFCFRRVATTISNEFSLAIGSIKSYEGAMERNGAVHSQCQESFKCGMCSTTGHNGNILFLPGDFYIVGLVPVHNRQPNSLQCGDIRTSSVSVDIAEAMHYAVKALNQRSEVSLKLTGKVTFGLILIDTCVHPFVIQDRITIFNNGALKLNSYINSSEILDKVIGYIGPAHSSVAVPLASVMNEIQKVYISYSATTSSLSNRQRFPYFMRTISPDYKQAKVIMGLAKLMESKYVQIIYSDEEYGITGRDAMLKAAKDRAVCVAQSVAVPDTTDNRKFQGYISDIRKYRHARLLIVFLLPHMVPGFMEILGNDMDFGEFVFIGGEGWAQRRDVLGHNDVFNTKLRGSLTITQKLPKNIGFEEYYKTIDIQESSNPWLQDYMEARANCYFPKSFYKHYDNPCTPELIAQHRQTDTWVPFTINTVYALALGFHEAVSSVCGGLAFCPEYSTEKLIEHIKNVRLDIYNNNNSIHVFDDNGEGNVGYTISQIVAAGQTLQYREIGLSSDTGIQLSVPVQSLQEAKFSSGCPNDVECTTCSDQFQDTTIKTPDNDHLFRMDGPLFIGLAATTCVFFVAMLILIVCLVFRSRKTVDENPYAVPNPVNESSYDCLDIPQS